MLVHDELELMNQASTQCVFHQGEKSWAKPTLGHPLPTPDTGSKSTIAMSDSQQHLQVPGPLDAEDTRIRCKFKFVCTSE